MKRLVAALLILASLSLLLAIATRANRSSAQQPPMADFPYGLIDVDGDGLYTDGDAFVVDYLLAKCPHHIEEALRTATRNPDGGLDVSRYLLSFSIPVGRSAQR